MLNNKTPEELEFYRRMSPSLPPYLSPMGTLTLDTFRCCHTLGRKTPRSACAAQG